MKWFGARLLKHVGMSPYDTLVVLKDSDKAITSTLPYTGHEATVGVLWMAEHFPASYAGFITHLMKHTSKWNTERRLTCYLETEKLSFDIEDYSKADAKGRMKPIKIVWKIVS